MKEACEKSEAEAFKAQLEEVGLIANKIDTMASHKIYRLTEPARAFGRRAPSAAREGRRVPTGAGRGHVVPIARH